MDAETLKSIKEAAVKGGYKAEEVEALLNVAHIMCSKPIKEYLKIIVNTLKPDNTEDLLILIEAIKANDYVGSQMMEIKGYSEHKIHFQLGVVPRDYQLDIWLPKVSKEKQQLIAQNLLMRMDKFADMANVYYKHVMQTHQQLYTTLSTTFPNVDFSAFKINQHTRVMSFDGSFDLRMGIVLSYTDRDGTPITS
jgi:hypothetical protein